MQLTIALSQMQQFSWKYKKLYEKKIFNCLKEV